MKITYNSLVEIHERQSLSFLVGKIIYGDKLFLYIKNVSTLTDYQGFALVSIKNVSRLVYTSKCISFYSAVLRDLEEKYIFFKTPKEMITFCFKNSKVVEVSTFEWGDFVEVLFILSISDSGFIGQRINRNGELQRRMEILFDNISYILYDSVDLKNYEKFLLLNDCFSSKGDKNEN